MGDSSTPSASISPILPTTSASWIIAGGAISGILADAVTHPMSTAKTRLQVQRNNELRGLFHALTSIAQKEGWRKLYTGFGVTVMTGPARALYFGGYEFAKIQGGKILGNDHPFVALTSGLFAQFCGSLLWVPMDVVKERMQVQKDYLKPPSLASNASSSLPFSSSSSTTSTIPHYTGTMNAAIRIFNEEGLYRLYRGFFLHQFLWGPYNAIYWPILETLRNSLSTRNINDGSKSLSIYLYPTTALIAGAIAGGATAPMDTIKARLQTQKIYKNAWDCLKKTVAQEGVKALFRGGLARVLWISPNMTLTISIYDSITKYFARS